MNLDSPLVLAQAAPPLLSNVWFATVLVLCITAILVALINAFGRWIAAAYPPRVALPATATSPVATAAPAAPAAAAADDSPAPDVLLVIAAAVAATFGASARVASVRAVGGEVAIETPLQPWSLEGRRQIYSSHQVR